MAAALKYKITLNQGSTYRQSFIWRAGPEGSEVAVDNTNYLARMHFRENLDDVATIIEVTEIAAPNGDVITLQGASGQVDIFISDETTTALTVSGGVYDLELEAPGGGDVTRILEGAFIVSPEVTR